MGKCSEVFVGIDTGKKRHAVAIAEAGVIGRFGILAKSTAHLRRWNEPSTSWPVGTRKCTSVTKLDRQDMDFTDRFRL